MRSILFSLLLFTSSLIAYETTNLQLLYSNNFKGDVFIYDTVDGEKTTLTFEHFRTFSLGDMYMFVDIMDGEKFNNTQTELYSEIAPRFSLSKLFNTQLSFSILKDFYIATQLNIGNDYKAYLGGIGVDLKVPGFNYVNLNIYYLNNNIDAKKTYQISSAYETKPYYNFHFEGFIDITSRAVNTQQQFLYNLRELFHTKEQIFLGTEWLYYDYDYKGISSNTKLFQAMIKYKF